MKIILLASLLISAFLFASEQDSGASEWDLDTIYPTDADWNNEVSNIQQSIQEIDKHSGQVTSALELADLLDAIYRLRARTGKLAKVGLLQHFTDTKNAQFQRRMEQSEFLEVRVESAVAFLDDLVTRIPKQTLASWQQESPRLHKHQRRINRILRTAPYKLPPDSESVLADLTRLPRTANDMYRQLLDSQLNWPEYQGKSLTPANYSNIRRNSSLKDREEASEVFFEHLGNYEELFALALTRRIEGDALIAKHRGLAGSVDTLLVMQDGFESNSHQHIYKAIQQSADKIAVIVDAIARTKSQPFLVPSDFRSLVKQQNRDYPLDYAREVTLKAADLISPQYRKSMASRLSQPWMHISDGENKSNTVGVFWQVGGGNPHTIFKYKNDYISFRLYSSAAFLMMGLAEIPEQKAPDRREEDLPVFSNALWYLGHYLQTEVLLRSDNSAELKKQILANLLTRSLNTLVNYAVMVELEDYISNALLSGDSVTAQDINQHYLHTLRRFFAGTDMQIRDYWQRGWINESFAFYGPHYASFYQAITSALALKSKILQGEQRALHIVQHGIAQSDTHYSADVLKTAGIGLNSLDTYLAAIDALYVMAMQLTEIK